MKHEPYQILLVVGDDKFTYEEDDGAPISYLLGIKLVINSVISNAKQGARLCSYEPNDLFLDSPMD